MSNRTAAVSILLPFHNEAATVETVVDTFMQLPIATTLQLIAVDDGSTDGGSNGLVGYMTGNQVIEFILISHSINRGKGAAIQTGLSLVTSPLVVVQDADLEYDPHELIKLIERMRWGDCDVVYGSRCLRESNNPKRWNLFAWGVSLLNLMVRVLYGVRLTDEATCYKLFRAEDLRRMDLQCQRFEFCPEVTAKACRMGLKIVEVPISYRPRSRGEGKKIRLRDGWDAVKSLWRYRNWQAEEKLVEVRTQVSAEQPEVVNG